MTLLILVAGLIPIVLAIPAMMRGVEKYNDE